MIKQKPIKFKSKQEWLDGRMNSIGSSEVAAIMNLSKWMSPLDVYNKIVNKKMKVVPPNERMAIGTLSEPLIRKQFALDTIHRYKVYNPPRHNWVFLCPFNNRISCSPDGIFRDLITKDYYGLEIKHIEIIKREDKEKWESDQLPNYYFTQCLQYQIVIPVLKGTLLLAHLVYKQYDQATDSFLTTKTENKQFWIFRKDEQKNLDYMFKKECEFLSDCDKHIKPKTLIVI